VPVVVVMEGLFGILEAAQRFAMVNAVKVPFYLSSALLPVAGVALGLGLDGVAWMLLAAVVVICVVQASMCLRVFPVLWGVPRVHRAELRALAGFGGWVMVSNAVNPLLTYVERLAIGMLRSIGAVTRYTAPSEMIMRLSLLAACLSDTLFPAFSTLAGQGRFDVLATFASRAVKYLFLLLGPTVILTVAFGRGMLELWLGPGVQDESVTALQWLAVGVLVNSLASVPYAVVQACGRPDVTARFHLVELPVHALVVWALVSAWGIPGAALAWTLRVTLDAVLLFAAGDRLGFLPLRAFASGRVRLGALLLLVLGLLAFGTQSAGLPAMLARLSVPGSGAAALQVVVPWLAALAASVSMWAFVLDDEDRAHARRAFGAPSGEGT
jgi:O-antigen/teichoic acid export membrane protein